MTAQITGKQEAMQGQGLDLEQRFAIVVDAVQMEVELLAAPLREQCRAFLDELAAGEFARLAACLPYLLVDVAPLDEGRLRRLGAAGLYGWWFIAAQDRLLDGEVGPAVLPGAGLALAQALEIYRELGLDRGPVWSRLQEALRRSAESYALEQELRFSGGRINPVQARRWGRQAIVGRAAPFLWGCYAQAHLAGYNEGDERTGALVAAIEALLIARQIGDDAADWEQDLHAGRMSYVVARLAEWAAPVVETERLAGRQLCDEEFWETIAATHTGLCRAAIEQLEHIAARRLHTLAEGELRRGDMLWQAGRRRRAHLRAWLDLDLLA